MTTGLFAALRQAGNYYSTGDAARAIAKLPGRSLARWNELDQIVRDNGRVHEGILASRELRPLYAVHDRLWPPTRPCAEEGS